MVRRTESLMLLRLDGSVVYFNWGVLVGVGIDMLALAG